MPHTSTLESRVEAAVDVYRQHSRSFRRMAQHVHDTIRDKCDPSIIQNITFRAKDPEALVGKCLRTDEGEPKYSDYLNEITDLAGVRVIVYTKSAVSEVCRVISEIYNVEEQEDVGDRVYKQGRFGYQSVHMLIHLDKRMYLGKEKAIDKAVCEIQVRTLLQHAWAEMEHDIQYKGTQVPVDIAKRFSALAGLLEIADGEFQRIQEDSQLLKESIQEKLVNDLTQQGLAAPKAEPDSGAAAADSVHRVRDLVAIGRYEDALEWYNRQLDAQPTNHTLFIGRAKLLFLMGDSTRAIEDIDAAARLSPADPVVARTKSLIQSGDIDALREQGSNSGNTTGYDADKIQEGFAALSSGDGVRAFDVFAELEGRGYNKAFAQFNKAMACTLESDLGGARDFLATLKIIPTTPMSVNIRALEYVIERMSGGAGSENLRALANALAFVPHYSLSQSHLIHLLKGLQKRKSEIADSIVSDLVLLGLSS